MRPNIWSIESLLERYKLEVASRKKYSAFYVTGEPVVPQKKYQVFVSSTFRDLVEERQDAIRNILDLKHIPAGMELFPASDTDQLSYIKKVIDECDYYLLIMGGRYGSMDSDGISFTEREYDYAVATGKFVVAFVHSDPTSIPLGKSDTAPEVASALSAFREKVMSGRLVKQWKDRRELEGLVLKSLIHAFNEFPQVGWIRGDSAANEATLEQSNRIIQENLELRQKISKLTPAVSVKIDDIADLDDKFGFSYEYKRTAPGGYGSTYHKASQSLTWRQIFCGVAGQLDRAKSDICLTDGVKLAMKKIGADHELYRLNENDKITIKIQLIALNLITAKVSKSTNGHMIEFLSLTEKGRSVFYSETIVRKAVSQPNV